MPSLSDWQEVYRLVLTILDDPAGFLRGRPVFKNIQQVDAFVTRYCGQLVSNTPYGPKGPDSRQIIWKIGDHVLIKIKTMGYNGGPRAGRATMSITITDGKGHAWANEIYKITGKGAVVDPNVITHNQTVAGKRPTSPHEVVQLPPGARNQHQVGLPEQERRQQKWADATHLDLETGFNPSGARNIGRIVTSARVRALGKGIAGAILTILAGVVLVRLINQAQQDDLQRQWEALQPEIENQLQQQSNAVVAYLKQGKRPYANVRFHIFSMTVFTQTMGGPDIRTETAPKLRLDSVRVSDNNINTEEPLKQEHTGITITNTRNYTVSFELGI